MLHSATVRNPRAQVGVPQGGMEAGEIDQETAAREFQEETGLVEWSFREGFEKSLSYTYIRRGRKVIKTVTYYVVEVHDAVPPASFGRARRGSRRATGTTGARSTKSPASSTTPRSARSSPRPTPGSSAEPRPSLREVPPRISPDYRLIRIWSGARPGSSSTQSVENSRGSSMRCD